ncbi:MAG TPA: hypothetical protein VLJ38_11675 [Polyangiaceae bacterium]|nr:hypothetical protein [Polyangiaceae bacterium]
MPRTLVSSLPLLSLLGLVSCTGETLSPDNSKTDVSQIVYAVRQHTLVDGNGNATTVDVAGGMGQVMDYGRYEPGGRLEVYDLRTFKAHNLIADLDQADITSVDVSYDATRVLFTMKTKPDDKYHVYWAALSPNDDGVYERHQLTFGDYDDINAIWADQTRIVFVTNQAYTPMGTRADEYNHSRVVTQLGTVTVDGGDADRKLCSQNLSHIVNLFSMSDGRVGFSRWEHLENVNDVKLFAMNPDCTQMVALGGQHAKPNGGNSLVQVTESTTANVFYGVVTTRENTIQAGSLFRYDARAAKDPTRIDEEKADGFKVVTPLVPVSDDPSPVGRYRSPAVMPNGKLLVSWAKGVVNDQNEFSLTPPDYGIYLLDEQSGENDIVVNYTDTWELYARPVVARQPVGVPSRQDNADGTVPAIIGSVDIRQTSLTTRHGEHVSGAEFDDTTMDDAFAEAVRVRIIEGFSSEAAPGATMFGLTMSEGAAILGEAKINSDGSWMAEVPPYVPMHLQPVDRYDLAIRSQTTWIQGMPGERRVCGGCHEDRTANVQPAEQQVTVAAGNDPEHFNLQIADRTEFPWAYANEGHTTNEIQALLNQRCVQCHNGTTNGDKAQEFYTVSTTDVVTGETTAMYMIPRLDLTDTPITVTYDRQTKTYPMSYVSLFYPAALQMEMGRDGAMIQGTVPPRWAIPSDARHSKLIEKLNVTSETDPKDYAWKLGTPIEADDNGGIVAGGTHVDHAAVAGMTRDELVKLVRAIDMGGQFYSRQNTAFAPFTSDPVGGGSQ